ncbi:MAG: F0F1 ATP synthase subunit B [Bacteroidales bacterium]|nr:MAG: F0F1 ATP synthase subunit B [Bacteroidales bacterium]
MELVTPGLGLLFWMLLSFSIVLYILKRFAWKPILKALKDREKSIQNALDSAELERQKMEQLKADNEAIMREAREERDFILQDAREVKDKIILEAKEQAGKEAKKIVDSARIKIRNEKAAAIEEIRNQVANLSVDVAEKILKQKLKDTREQKELISKLLDEIELN